MTSIAAILTIVGYSLNETVVVFDRTRELMRRYKSMPASRASEPVDQFHHVADRHDLDDDDPVTPWRSCSSAGGRSRALAKVMLCGVFICTYSAIFISTPVLIYLGVRSSGGCEGACRQGRSGGTIGAMSARPDLRRLPAGPRTRSMLTATAGSASPTCPIAVPSLRCRRHTTMPVDVTRRNHGRGRSGTRVSPRVTPSTSCSVGDGPRRRGDPPDTVLPASCREAPGIGLDVMQTGAAARTYNVLVGENRRVGSGPDRGRFERCA